MGTIAVIPEGEIQLLQLHVNLWILPGLGRQVRFLDVGFRFEVQCDQLETFDLAIPGSGKKKPADLHEYITSESGSLIFGVPIECDTQGRISPTQKLSPDYISATLVQLSEFTPQRTEDLNAGVSLWRCRLAKPWTSDDGPGYCRVRFFVPDPGRMWTHPGVSPLDGRSLFDLRILDVRENIRLEIAPDIRMSGVEVTEAVNTHLIVPEEFEILDTAENHKYVRLLETEAWRQYLGRKAHLPLTSPKMLAVSWEKRGNVNDPAAEVTQPARFACMLRKHTLTLAFSRLLAAIIVAALVTWFLIGSDMFRGGPADDMIDWLNDKVPAKVPGLPRVEGSVEKLLQVVLSIPFAGLVVGVAVLARWPWARRQLGLMRSGLEAFLVGAESHGRY